MLHEKWKKIRLEKKQLVWLLAGGLLLCILMGIGWLQYQAEERQKALALSAQHLLERQTEYHQAQGLLTIDSLERESTPVGMLAVLTDQSGQPVADLEDLQKERLNALSETDAFDLVQFTFQAQDSSLAGVRDVHLMEKHYTVKETDYENLAEEEHELASLYIKEDGRQFTLDDFLKDKERFLASISEKLKQSGWTEAETALSVEQISEKAQTLPVTLTDHSLILLLGSDSTPVEIAFSENYDSIKADLLIGEARVAYEAYLVEKAAEEERLVREAALRAKGPNPVAEGKVVALTFDDGPDPNTTKQLQTILHDNKVRATFFVLGQKVAGNEALLRELLEDGHQLANHSWSHPKLTKLTPDQIRAEIGNTQQAIYNATGVQPTVLRPPYGSSNMTVAQAAGLPIVNWTVDTLDWQSRNTEAILNQVKKQVHPGAVILMHDIHQTSVDAVQPVIDYLKAEGYTFVTINELYGY